MRTVDLAIYADTLAGEHAALAARLEQAHARLREAAIERDARAHLPSETVKELEALGIIGGIDDRTRSSSFSRGSKAGWSSAWRKCYEEAAIRVVRGEEVRLHGLPRSGLRPELELLAEPPHAPFE